MSAILGLGVCNNWIVGSDSYLDNQHGHFWPINTEQFSCVSKFISPTLSEAVNERVIRCATITGAPQPCWR